VGCFWGDGAGLMELRRALAGICEEGGKIGGLDVGG